MTDTGVKHAETAPDPDIEYWRLLGMSHDPFAEASVAGLYFAGADREQLLQSTLRMTRFATQVAVFAGTPGVGKTKLLEALTTKLEGVSFVLRLQGSFMLTVEQLFGQIGDTLGLQAAELAPDELRAQILQRVQHGVAHSKSLIVLVDDAHELPEHTLASLLALAQDDSNNIKLLLFAATDANGDLRPELARDDIQRVDIAPLDLNGVEDYLRYRLTVAGYDGPFPFTKADLLSVFEHGGGIPEHMHDMAEQKLRAALVEQPQSPPPAPVKMRVPWLHVAASVGLLIFIAALWTTGDDDTAPVKAESKTQATRSIENIPPPKQTTAEAPEKSARLPAAEIAQRETDAQAAAVQEKAVPTAKATEVTMKPVVRSTAPKSEATGSKPAVKMARPQVKIVVADPPAEPPVSNPVKVVEKSVAASAAGYTSDERYLLNLPASHYTLQLVGSKSLQGVHDFAKRHKESKIVVFRQRLNNKPWYVAVTGDYPNQEQATTALTNLPTSLRELKPWARPLSKVQGDIKSARDVR
ncbi:MAG: SPOR domain-containing protein [Pseudomonadales bacterium]